MRIRFPLIAEWLERWCYELSLVQWSVKEPNLVNYHAAFQIVSDITTYPVHTFDENFKNKFEALLTQAEDVSGNFNYLVSLGMRLDAYIDPVELRKEVETLTADYENAYKSYGFTKFDLSKPLNVHFLLAHIYSIEITARLRAYNAFKHNPVLGYEQPALLEALQRFTKESEG